MAKRAHRDKAFVGSLGHALKALREHLNVSKNQIEWATVEHDPATKKTVRPGINHTVLGRLELGDRHLLEYETLWRAISGINIASEEGRVGPSQMRDLFRACFADRLLYEVAKYAVYQTYVTGYDPADPEVLPPLLQKLKEELVADGIGNHPIIGKGVRKAVKPPTLAEATGFAAVQIMAEEQAAHPYRVSILVERFPYLAANWKTGEVIVTAERGGAGGESSPKIVSLAERHSGLS